MAPEHADVLDELVGRFHRLYPNEPVEFGYSKVKGGVPVTYYPPNGDPSYESTTVERNEMFIQAIPYGSGEWGFEERGTNIVELFAKFGTWLEARGI